MHSININLSPDQIRKICNALNTEAKRLRDVDRPTQRPGHDVRDMGATKLNRWSAQLIRHSTANDHNPHIPCVLE